MSRVEVSAVTVRLGTVTALDGVSFAVDSGSRLAVVGASGSGKSTLLRAIAGLIPIGAGSIALDGRVVSGPGTMVPAHRRGVGYVPQDGALFPHLTVERNIRFGVRRGTDRAARVRETAALVGLEPGLLRRYPDELSGGQQQRVALARALAARPAMIVLDEPFSALDTGLRERARAAVTDALQASGVTGILVTHDQDEALAFGDAIGVLDHGRLVQLGPAQAVFDDPVSPRIAAFLGAACFVAGRAHGDVADTALGPVPLRRNHAVGDGCLVMLRPNQFVLERPSPSAEAHVEAVVRRGATLRVSLALPGGGEQIEVEVSASGHDHLGPGDAVGVRVIGSGVGYPTDGAKAGGH